MALSSIVTCNVGISANIDATYTVSGLPSPVSGGFALPVGGALSLGTGASAVNEAVSIIKTIGTATSHTYSLAASLTNIMGVASVTLARVKYLMIQLLSVAQDATNGTACSSITIGAAASNPWTGIIDAAGLYTVRNGAFWIHGDFSATGCAIGADLNLKVLNNDASNTAAYRLTILGCAT